MRNIRLLTLVSALVFAGTGLISPVMTLYLKDLGANFAEISLILTTFTATALCANYASGFLSDRLRRRKPLLAGGLLVMGVAYFWLARVPNASLAWPVRVLEGVGSGAYATLSLAMMGDLLEQSAQRGRRMGFFRGVGSLCFAAGAFAGGWLVAHLPIASMLIITGGCYLLAALVALAVDEIRPTPAAAKTLTTAEPAAPQRLPLAFLSGVALWTGAVMAAATMWPNAMEQLGYSRQTISSLWGLAALIEAPGMQIAGVLSDSLGRAPLLVAGALGVALVFAGYMLVARWLVALSGVQVIRGFAYSAYTATAMTFAAEHGSRRTRGSVSGVFTAVTSGGQLAGTLLSGLIVQMLGFNALFGLCTLAGIGSALSFLTLHRTEAGSLSLSRATKRAKLP